MGLLLRPKGLVLALFAIRYRYQHTLVVKITVKMTAAAHRLTDLEIGPYAPGNGAWRSRVVLRSSR